MNEKSLIRDNMPQFGAEHIVEDPVLGGYVWKDPKTGFLCSPVISVDCDLWPAVPVRIDPNTPVNIFGSGTEAAMWDERNCEACNRQSCALYDRISIAWGNDGKIPFKAAKRIGCALTIQQNGVFARLDPTCNEKL